MKCLSIVIAILLSVSLAGAEMYQWIADDGSVTFKDTPPPALKKRKKVKVYNDSDFASTPAQPLQTVSGGHGNKSIAKPTPTTAKKERFSGMVEIYVTNWCGYCKQALSYMSSKGIQYVAYDIENDNSAKQRYKELGGRGVPLIIIGAHRMSGFSESNFEYYLNNHK